jgi:cytochrome c553
MKVVSLQLALRVVLRVVIPAIAFPAAVPAGASDISTFSEGGLKAKIQYCQDCHGRSGQGYLGYFAIPRLAGQTTEYFENQLSAFASGKRGTDVISRWHCLSPDMRATLAEHFSGLTPQPFGGAPRRLVDAGKKIYEEGVPENNVPACLACHGPEARGEGAVPRLAGQLYPYAVKVLTNWSKERPQPSTPAQAQIMMPIAHNLNRTQIESLAEYVSYLK